MHLVMPPGVHSQSNKNLQHSSINPPQTKSPSYQKHTSHSSAHRPAEHMAHNNLYITRPTIYFTNLQVPFYSAASSHLPSTLASVSPRHVPNECSDAVPNHRALNQNHPHTNRQHAAIWTSAPPGQLNESLDYALSRRSDYNTSGAAPILNRTFDAWLCSKSMSAISAVEVVPHLPAVLLAVALSVLPPCRSFTLQNEYGSVSDASL